MENQKDTNAHVSQVNAAWLWRVVKLESLPIMLLLFAVFYSNGYAYLETYHGKLGMPVNRLGYDAYQFVVFGGIDVLVKFAALLIVITAVAILTCLIYFTENPDRVPSSTTLPPMSRRYRLSQRLSKSYTKARLPVRVTLLLTFLAMGMWSIWTLTFSQSIARGKLNAYEEIRKCKPSTVLLKNLDVVTACVVGESDDMLYLIDKHTEDGKILFQERSIPKDSIRSTTGPATPLEKPA
ncbi:hypothetical protein LRS56_06990 [Pseudomonas poae]|nr:hypothetical protein LRS56_06990 [Pseudomonas poae]